MTRQLTSQRRVMFNTVMDINVTEIESVCVVVAIQDASDIIRDKVAETRSEVVGVPDDVGHVTETDISRIMW